jgi:hypothetical protein
MKTYAILRRAAWANGEAAEQAVGRSDQAAAQMPESIHRVRTYVLGEGGDALGSICIYRATNEQAIREHADRADLPADSVVEVVDTIDYADSFAGVAAASSQA